MPRELIFGRTVTVRRGDLLDPATEPSAEPDPTTRNVEALAARHLDVVRERDELTAELRELHARRADLLLNRDQLRRRYQLLAAFADDLAQHHGDASTPLDFARYFAEALTTLRAGLAAHPLVDPTADDPTAALDPDDPDLDDTADTADLDGPASQLAEVAAQPRRFRRAGEESADDLVRVRPALELTWLRDGAQVSARVAVLDEETGAEVRPRAGAGSVLVDLDWSAANRAIRKFRVARDQSHGTPE